MRVESQPAGSSPERRVAAAVAFASALARARAAAAAAKAAALGGEPGTDSRPVPVGSGAPGRGSARRRVEGDPGRAGAGCPGDATSNGGLRMQAVLASPSTIQRAAALDRLVVDFSNRAGGASLTLAFGSDGPVLRLRKLASGIEMVLEPPPSRLAGSMAELAALATAVRARGVAVVSATVRIRAVPRVRPAGAALTARPSSDRTARQSNPGGTVAKW